MQDAQELWNTIGLLTVLEKGVKISWFSFIILILNEESFSSLEVLLV